MDAGSLLSIISLALDTWSCQSPTVFCFVTEGPPRLGGSLASLRQQRKIVCVIKWRYYRFTHTSSEYVFLLHSSLFPICYCYCTAPPRLVSVSLSYSPHDGWIKTRKRRQSTKRSVLADSSDLGIYGEALGSDIHPGCCMCTAYCPSKAAEIPCAQLNISMVTDILTRVFPKRATQTQKNPHYFTKLNTYNMFISLGSIFNYP